MNDVDANIIQTIINQGGIAHHDLLSQSNLDYRVELRNLVVQGYVTRHDGKTWEESMFAVAPKGARLLKRYIDNRVLSDWDNIRVCEVCGDRECVAPATKCHACRIQEMIDND